MPVLFVRVGVHRLAHGTLGATRSLGRAGVPVYGLNESRLSPAAASRYLTRSFGWNRTGGEPRQELVRALREIGTAIGGRALLVPTDDEGAVLVAEAGASLGDGLIAAQVPPGMPVRLASKHSLSELCREHRVPTPATIRPSTVEGLLAEAAALSFPVVLKNDEPWQRLTRPAFGSTTVIRRPADLEAVAGRWTAMPNVVLQEYIDPAQATDWIVHAYCGSSPERSVAFTGVKVRSWPPLAGVTTFAYSADNPELAAAAMAFCTSIGYRGICDLDWRLDHRDGHYKLVDFNPRLGAQFRLFISDTGVDVVRAMHLDLTGRPIPSGVQVSDRRYVVEVLDMPARAAYRIGRHPTLPIPAGPTEYGWWALDDPVPALLAFARAVGPGIGVLRRTLAARRRVPAGESGGR